MSSITIYHYMYFIFFSSRRRHTRFDCDWSSDVCSSDLGGLQDVEFLAEVLNRTEKALRKHRECGKNAKGERAGENTVSAGPINQGDSGKAEKFDGRIEESVGENRIAPGEHIVAIALLKFLHGLAFTVEELHNTHSGM